jgi:hypothetical protein
LAWKTLEKEKREKTLTNLHKLYDSINNPFKFREELGDNIRNRHLRMIERLLKIELIEEVSNAVTLFDRMTDRTVIPKLPRVERVLEGKSEDENVSIFNKAQKEVFGSVLFGSSRTTQGANYNTRILENPEIVKGFSTFDKNFKIIEDKQEALAMLMTCEITINRDELQKMKKELEENRLVYEKCTETWQELERRLGSNMPKTYEDYRDKLNKTFMIESFKEREDRRMREDAFDKEITFLNRAECAIRTNENEREMKKRDEAVD